MTRQSDKAPGHITPLLPSAHLLQLVAQSALAPQLLAARAVDLRLQRLGPLGQTLALAPQPGQRLLLFADLGGQGLEAGAVLAAHPRGRLQLAQPRLWAGRAGRQRGIRRVVSRDENYR